MDRKYQVQTVIQISPEQLEEMLAQRVNQLLDNFREEEQLKHLPHHMTRGQVSEYYQVSLQTVVNWEKEGRLTRSILGDSVIRYEKEQVLALKK